MQKLQRENLLTEEQTRLLLGLLDEQVAMEGQWHTTGGTRTAPCS